MYILYFVLWIMDGGVTPHMFIFEMLGALGVLSLFRLSLSYSPIMPGERIHVLYCCCKVILLLYQHPVSRHTSTASCYEHTYYFVLR